MDRPITRRDFIGGVAVGLGSATWLAGCGPGNPPVPPDPGAQMVAGYYPPGLTGLRGDHDGSFEAAHKMRGGPFPLDGAIDRRETYDLIVVGGGISGLSAAHYFRQQAGPAAKVLVLDNHDDFGGHAKRNEFTHNGRTWIGYGGTQSIDSPAPYSATARALIADLGVDVARYEQVLDRTLYPSLGLSGGTFFDKETFGADRLVVGTSRNPSKEFLAGTPLPKAVQQQILKLTTEKRDFFPGLSSAEKKARLARMSYADFVTKEWKLDPLVLGIYQTRTYGLFGFGVDAVPAQDAWALGLPGFQGMNLEPGNGPGQNHDSLRHPDAEEYYFHFPDGNASIARLLVRRLIPAAVPGTSADDVVTAAIDYAKLDDEASPARIRLNSTVVGVAHDGPAASATGVTVHYARDGKVYTVRGKAVVLACWHHVIPHICQELPETQLAALRYAKKVPLVYTNIFIRQWTAFEKLKVNSISSPGLWHASTNLDFPVSLGSYAHTKTPAEPVVLHMTKAACKPGLPGPAQHVAGRAELLNTSFETIERGIRDQLGRMLGGGGFDPAGDILAVTVNRWPHGYAYQYNSLADPFWLEGGEQPCAVARKPFGRIAIANSDSAAYAYTDAAIDHGYRAVMELTAKTS
ncbi:MAG: FAD-dependent oxidoreductase [Acidobacteria bacterium]|nr:FAD-dependent oxidoreductase [Acidobacteriota bacterium]